MAQISQSTVDHSKTDIANNPDHVQAQQLEALTPAATRPTSPGQLEDQDQDQNQDKQEQEDMEDKLSNALAPSKSGAGGKSRSGSKKPRQKKIAVLTSGGDSAGMNAAGQYDDSFSTEPRKSRAANNLSVPDNVHLTT